MSADVQGTASTRAAADAVAPVRRNWPALLIAFLAILVPLCAFGLLARVVLAHAAFAWDVPLLQALHRNASPMLDRAMVFMSRIGEARTIVPIEAVAFAALVIGRRWRAATFWVIALGGASLLNHAAKEFFARTRPDLWISIAPETTYSFPSAHAMQTMALLAATLVLTWPTRWRWATLLLLVPYVALVGVSRSYLGVHYPSDVLAGWAAAGAWVLAVRLALWWRR